MNELETPNVLIVADQQPLSIANSNPVGKVLHGH
jgi:hypothetical protein